ncbi:MAG: cobalamin-dependent protein, partial [Candidatus Aminicenantes bacterium]|nr:cobalamin-dependent protein [Candidatus Aminicenantes bacterium]
MKILLVKPPLNRNIISPSGGEPLELEYLAASVKEHDVEILDMRVDRRLHRALETFRPQVVGLTGYTCDANSAKAVMREVKKFDPKVVTAVGGHHATFLPSDFALSFVDFVFLGM